MNVDTMTLIPYFAYGSNLDGNQMRKRCPGARVVGRMVLPNHSLAFVGRSKTWDGHGVATVIPRAGAQVDGLAYSLTDADWAHLDHFEGYPRVYDRRLLEVIDSSGKPVTARVYVHTSQERNAPAPNYLARIRGAYATLGIDPGPLVRASARMLDRCRASRR